MITYDKNKDTYQEVRKLPDASLFLIIASREYLISKIRRDSLVKDYTQDTYLENSTLIDVASRVFEDFFDKFRSQKSTEEIKVYKGQNGLNIVILVNTESGLLTTLNDLHSAGLYIK